MNFIQYVLFKLVNLVSNRRSIIAVDTDGNHRLRLLNFTNNGKVFIKYGSTIGYLDNFNQKKGEFRRGISSDNLVRWFII